MVSLFNSKVQAFKILVVQVVFNQILYKVELTSILNLFGIDDILSPFSIV